MNDAKKKRLNSDITSNASNEPSYPALLDPSNWVPIAAWAVFIFILSTNLGSEANTHSRVFHLIGWFWPGAYRLPFASQLLVEFYIRKCAHLTVYAVFGVLLHRAFFRAGFSAGKAARLAWLFAILYAATDEYHQTFVPTRTPLITDVGIDAIGGLIGIAIYRLGMRRRIRESESE